MRPSQVRSEAFRLRASRCRNAHPDASHSAGSRPDVSKPSPAPLSDSSILSWTSGSGYPGAAVQRVALSIRTGLSRGQSGLTRCQLIWVAGGGGERRSGHGREVVERSEAEIIAMAGRRSGGQARRSSDGPAAVAAIVRKKCAETAC